MKKLRLQPKFQINKKGLFLALLLLVLVFSIFAEEGPLIGTAEKIIEFISGKFVLLLCTLAIMGSGIMMVINKGQGSKIAFISIFVAVAIIQGAGVIAKMILEK